jgi:hypothetical protein
MPVPTLASPQVHLHWVRETPSRVLILPVSTSLPSLDALPPCAQTAVLATGLATVELHLPPYRPIHNPDFDAWLATLVFRQDAAGRLIATCSSDPDPLATMAHHHAVVLALRAVTNDETPLTLVAESPGSPLLRQPMPVRHACAPRGGLLSAPSERSNAYHRCYRAVSLGVQSAIRDYLPPAHIHSLKQFDDRDHILALFAWSASEPIVGRHVDALGVDVLNATSVHRAFSGVQKRITPRLEEVSGILHRHHARPLIRASYNPAKVGPIVRRCQQRKRYLNLLFSNEFRLITALIGFCAQIPSWRNRGAADPARVYRQVREEWERIELHLRHFYQRRPHGALGSRLLLAAVRALEAVD